MFVKLEGYVLPVTKALTAILDQVINDVGVDANNGIIINFRDPDYSAESGGYHPVEISINNDGKLLYITDFSYIGLPPFCELAKELDFDFSLGLFQHAGVEHPLQENKEIYQIWQENFCSYYQFGVFKVEVSTL